MPGAIQRLVYLKKLFAQHLYMEIQRHGTPSEAKVEPLLLDYAYKNDIPLVATNEPFFPEKLDYEAHDALLAIAQGAVVAQTARRKLTDQHYFKTRKQMVKLFADIPEALTNSVNIAKMVAFRPRERAPILPSFSVKKGTSPDEAQRQEAQQLTSQAEAGLKRRLADTGLADGYTKKDYDERLAFELKVIRDMKYPGYFLIVADFIQWAKDQDIPVGAGAWLRRGLASSPMC